jgi:hypothetical protein
MNSQRTLPDNDGQSTIETAFSIASTSTGGYVQHFHHRGPMFTSIIGVGPASTAKPVGGAGFSRLHLYEQQRPIDG